MDLRSIADRLKLHIELEPFFKALDKAFVDFTRSRRSPARIRRMNDGLRAGARADF